MIIEEKDPALARCRALVEKKLNWGSSADWSAQDFERLSERIAAETGVSLSATTLKRVWGKVKYDSVPTQTTLNALAKFLGHDNWRLFCVSNLNTSIYYYPGYFRAKLLVGDQIMQEHPVLIKTQGWKGIIEQTPLPMYLSNKEIALNGSSMEINAATLREKTGKSVFNDVWTHFYLVNDVNRDAGNFTFETVLQNTSAKEEAICQKVRIRILTSESAIGLPLCSKGCTSDASLFIGGTNISGKDRDLSAFGCDFSKTQRLKCTVMNKVFTVFLNGKSIFTAPANEDLGKIVGAVIGFEGAGKIESATFL